MKTRNCPFANPGLCCALLSWWGPMARSHPASDVFTNPAATLPARSARAISELAEFAFSPTPGVPCQARIGRSF